MAWLSAEVRRFSDRGHVSDETSGNEPVSDVNSVQIVEFLVQPRAAGHAVGNWTPIARGLTAAMLCSRSIVERILLGMSNGFQL